MNITTKSPEKFKKWSGFRLKALNFAIIAVRDPWSGMQNSVSVTLNRDPKSQKGPFRDPVPKIGTLWGTVASFKVIIKEYCRVA